MAGGLKLFDYRMTEKEHILAETIIEMTDKSELFRTGLEHFDWSEIKVIPTGDRPHDFSYTLKQEAWIELIDAVAAYPMFNTGGICVHAIDDAEDKVLASVNGENPEWCEMAEQPQEDGDEMESGFLFGSFFVAFSGVIRMGMD